MLDAAASGRVRLLWAIPPVVLVWANLHGGFLVGVGMLGLYGAAVLARWRLGYAGAISGSQVAVDPISALSLTYSSRSITAPPRA